jgi:hypothetical protein
VQHLPLQHGDVQGRDPAACHAGGEGHDSCRDDDDSGSENACQLDNACNVRDLLGDDAPGDGRGKHGCGCARRDSDQIQRGSFGEVGARRRFVKFGKPANANSSNVNKLAGVIGSCDIGRHA